MSHQFISKAYLNIDQFMKNLIASFTLEAFKSKNVINLITLFSLL